MNRLAREQSPYLLQHRRNPVDWYPWGEEAFEKARTEDKPIFLSIGYSTCHWCHVMERESFENPEVARLLNQHFVSVKVDREERPDVDKIYMTAVQNLTAQGGWPLTALLTTDLKVFFGGTYFPPTGIQGRPGLLTLLPQIIDNWHHQRAKLVDYAEDFYRRLREHISPPPQDGTPLNAGTLDRAALVLRRDYDPVDGGFGRAPKFPRPSQPAFLLQHGVRHGNEETIQMVVHTCDRMSRGGIYDQIGGGFARYSVDSRWLVPHFEKMLYDNAQLIHLYLDALLVSDRESFERIVRETLAYLARDLTHPDGGFYSAEDADSEGKEGKFYCWTLKELRELLPADECDVFVRRFGVTERGNFLDHSDPDPLKNQNVLSVVDDRLTEAEKTLLSQALPRVSAARSERVRPHRDDKILVSWNGLTLGAVARAYAVLGDADYLAMAQKNFDFLWNTFWDPESRSLCHRWRDGERDTVQLFQGYACFLYGTVELYEATLAPRYLQAALEVAESTIERFLDRKQGGFWQNGTDCPNLILRLKEDYDGAEPSGNSLAMLALQKLAFISGRKEYADIVQLCLKAFAEKLDQYPQAVPLMLQALDYSLHEPLRIVIHGPADSPEGESLIRAAHSVYRPDKVLLRAEEPGDEVFASLCDDQACRATTSDPAQIRAFLQIDPPAK